jgi:hypothetical protein
MKQNSSIVFHSNPKSLTNRYRGRGLPVALAFLFCLFRAATAADKPEYLDSFDPGTGFKPAQRDLTEIFLQIAGSLEAYGTPIPYIRHVASENERIDALFLAKYGTPPKRHLPRHVTPAYIDRIAANWNLLSPKLELEPFAREFGNGMREAINGTRGTGTNVVDILNQHQARVFDSMAGKSDKAADFKVLKTQIISQLELDKSTIDDRGYDVAHRDAVSWAIILRGTTGQLFQKVDRSLNPADAERVKTVLTGFILDVGQMAQSELEAGIAEWAINRKSAASN